MLKNHTDSESKDYLQRLKFLSILIAILLGLLHVWVSRHSMTADGIIYLDIADGFLKGDFKNTMLSSWCPLYPFMLSIGLYIFKPSPYWEFAFVHLINFIIYLGALFSFTFFLNELLKYHTKYKNKIIADKHAVLPSWALLVIGYALFIFSSLHLISLWMPVPDMLFSLFVYLATGLILGICSGTGNMKNFLLLGIVLGFGYLSKTPMFVIAFVYFLIIALFAEKKSKYSSKIFFSCLVFLLISLPYIWAISTSKGYFTIGESGKLNYAWYINDVPPFTHYQGGPPGKGGLIHPTRKIFESPAVYEFDKPFENVTYPAFYDPTYWYHGIKPYFDPFRQLCAIAASFSVFYKIFFKYLVVLFFAYFVLIYMGRMKKYLFDDLAYYKVLLLPAIFAFVMFSLVHMEARYIAPFVVIFWLSLFSSIRMPDTNRAKRLMECVTLLAVSIVMITTGVMSAQEISAWKRNGSEHTDWQIAETLKKYGIKQGDKIATIGYTVPHLPYWARLLKVKVISEIPEKDSLIFWESNGDLKNQVILTIAKTGAKAIIAMDIPECCSDNSWVKLGNSNSYLYDLTRVIRNHS